MIEGLKVADGGSGTAIRIDFGSGAQNIVVKAVTVSIGSSLTTFVAQVYDSTTATITGTSYLVVQGVPLDPSLAGQDVGTYVIDTDNQFNLSNRYLLVNVTGPGGGTAVTVTVSYLQIPTANPLNTNFKSVSGSFNSSAQQIILVAPDTGFYDIKSFHISTSIAGSVVNAYVTDGINQYWLGRNTSTTKSALLLSQNQELYLTDLYAIALITNNAVMTTYYHLSYCYDPLNT